MGLLGISNSIVTGLLPVTLSLFRRDKLRFNAFGLPKAKFASLSLLFPQNLCKQIFCGIPSWKAQLRYEYLEMVIILIILPYLFTFHFSLFTIYSPHLFTYSLLQKNTPVAELVTGVNSILKITLLLRFPALKVPYIPWGIYRR